MTTDTIGGVWQYSLALTRGLAEMYGCKVLLASFGQPNREDLSEAVPVPGVSLVTLDLKLEWMPDSRNDVNEASRQLTKLANEWRADVIHCNQFSFGQLDTIAPRLVVAHSDLLSWIAWHRNGGELDFDAVEEDRSLKSYRDSVALGLAGASAVACPSRFMSKHLDEAYGCPSETVYNGLWADVYHPAPKEQAAVLVGRLWDEAKMAWVAVEGLAGLPVQLKLAGPRVGPNGVTARLPEADNAIYLDSLSWRETRQVISTAAICLATSSYEPFGLSVLEAALSGCAIIANDIPPFRELWKDAALFYRRNDPADLRTKIERLLQHPEEVAKLGKASRAKALERYTGQKMAMHYYRLYREM